MQNFFKSLAVIASALSAAFAAPTPAPPTAPPTALNGLLNQVVEDNYIVVLKKDLSIAAVEEHQSWATHLHNRRLTRRDDTSLAGIKNTYSTVLKGYAGSFDADTIAAIEASDEVAYVEKDQIAIASGLVTQTGSPSWGIPRASQQEDVDFTKYYYDESAGEGTVVYVVDTGVLTTHVEFGERATFGADFTGSGLSDGNGHGTHVAGTIAGTTYGIAKKAEIVAVRVLNSGGSGTYAWVIAGIDFTASDVVARGKQNKAVANMSLGGGLSAAVNEAVAAAVEAGITYVVAGGNSNDDVKWYSPASEPTAITVGATDIMDERAYYSNYGPLLDIFAPGSNITSSWIGASNDVSLSISGTSMASPHVAGVAAYLIALEGLETPAAVDARIKELSTADVVINAGQDTTALFVFTGASLLLNQ